MSKNNGLKNMIDIKGTDGYKKNQLLYSSLDVACNEVKNIIMEQIVFNNYKPTKVELKKIITKKINDLMDEEYINEICKNMEDAIQEMYDVNEDEKVIWKLKKDNNLKIGYEEMKKSIEKAKQRSTVAISSEFKEIKKSVIKTITNDCYMLVYQKVPKDVVEKVKNDI